MELFAFLNWGHSYSRLTPLCPGTVAWTGHLHDVWLISTIVSARSSVLWQLHYLCCRRVCVGLLDIYLCNDASKHLPTHIFADCGDGVSNTSLKKNYLCGNIFSGWKCKFEGIKVEVWLDSNFITTGRIYVINEGRQGEKATSQRQDIRSVVREQSCPTGTKLQSGAEILQTGWPHRLEVYVPQSRTPIVERHRGRANFFLVVCLSVCQLSVCVRQAFSIYSQCLLSLLVSVHAVFFSRHRLGVCIFWPSVHQSLSPRLPICCFRFPLVLWPPSLLGDLLQPFLVLSFSPPIYPSNVGGQQNNMQGVMVTGSPLPALSSCHCPSFYLAAWLLPTQKLNDHCTLFWSRLEPGRNWKYMCGSRLPGHKPQSKSVIASVHFSLAQLLIKYIVGHCCGF